MRITKEEVRTLANLAKLHLEEAELETMTGELERILQFVSVIAQVDTAGVEATVYGAKLQNVFREDIIVPSYDRDLLLAGAPEQDDGQFLVPKVV